MNARSSLLLACTLLLASHNAFASELDRLLTDLRRQSGAELSTQRGAALWQQQVDGRSCARCHGPDLRAPGRHEKTGKPIAPLAPSANPDRLTEAKTINKWLLRNCKWTFGRECSPQEKGDLLSWLKQQ